MRLEDLTKTQLLNIIFRKDDVEAGLRAEIATLKQENRCMGKVKWTRTIGISLLFAVVCFVLLTLTSCGSNKQTTQEKDRSDKMAFEHPLLSFGDVAFGVNVNEKGIILISSTQVDDPRVMSIVNYLNGIFGEAWEDEGSYYWWKNDGQCKALGSTIRLRPLHADEGGTVIMIY